MASPRQGRQGLKLVFGPPPGEKGTERHTNREAEMCTQKVVESSQVYRRAIFFLAGLSKKSCSHDKLTQIPRLGTSSPETRKRNFIFQRFLLFVLFMELLAMSLNGSPIKRPPINTRVCVADRCQLLQRGRPRKNRRSTADHSKQIKMESFRKTIMPKCGDLKYLWSQLFHFHSRKQCTVDCQQFLAVKLTLLK